MIPVTEVPKSLNELITAVGKQLGGKYTVHHMPGEDKKNKSHNIAVIDNDIGVAAYIQVPRPFGIKSEDELVPYVKVVCHEALKSISIVAEGNPENLLYHG